MDLELLRGAGLTDSESKVYLSLLKIGDSTRGEIVSASGIAGSKVYENLEKLHQKGLVSWYITEGIKHFKPMHPKHLITFLESQKETILRMEARLRTILPSLIGIFAQSKEDQEVELLHGMKGLEAVFLEQIDILNKGGINYVIGGTKGIDEEAMQAFFVKIHRLRQQRGIRTRMLYNLRQKKAVDALYANSEFSLTEVKYLPHTSPVSINIYANRVIIVIFGQDMTLIHIKSKETSHSFMEYFNILWKQGVA